MYDLLSYERVELKVRDFDVIVPRYNNKTSKTTAAQVNIIKQDCLHACKDSSDMIKWMLKGYCNRTKTAHSMNDYSSRSHCLFSILVKQEFKKEQKVINSKINICDLAGSERIKKTNVSGEQLAEAVSTSTSLSVLNSCSTRCYSSCIRSLTDKSATYIPYRHSRLTWLLQDTLGGTAKTVVLGTISSSASEYSETLLTLDYIKLAKQMTPSKLEAESLLKEVVVEQTSMTKSRSVALRRFRKVGYAAIWIYRVKKRAKTEIGASAKSRLQAWISNLETSEKSNDLKGRVTTNIMMISMKFQMNILVVSKLKLSASPQFPMVYTLIVMYI